MVTKTESRLKKPVVFVPKVFQNFLMRSEKILTNNVKIMQLLNSVLGSHILVPAAHNNYGSVLFVATSLMKFTIDASDSINLCDEDSIQSIIDKKSRMKNEKIVVVKCIKSSTVETLSTHRVFDIFGHNKLVVFIDNTLVGHVFDTGSSREECSVERYSLKDEIIKDHNNFHEMLHLVLLGVTFSKHVDKFVENDLVFYLMKKYKSLADQLDGFVLEALDYLNNIGYVEQENKVRHIHELVSISNAVNVWHELNAANGKPCPLKRILLHEDMFKFSGNRLESKDSEGKLLEAIRLLDKRGVIFGIRYNLRKGDDITTFFEGPTKKLFSNVNGRNFFLSLIVDRAGDIDENKLSYTIDQLKEKARHMGKKIYVSCEFRGIPENVGKLISWNKSGILDLATFQFQLVEHFLGYYHESANLKEIGELLLASTLPIFPATGYNDGVNHLSELNHASKSVALNWIRGLVEFGFTFEQALSLSGIDVSTLALVDFLNETRSTTLKMSDLFTPRELILKSGNAKHVIRLNHGFLNTFTEFTHTFLLLNRASYERVLTGEGSGREIRLGDIGGVLHV